MAKAIAFVVLRYIYVFLQLLLPGVNYVLVLFG